MFRFRVDDGGCYAMFFDHSCNRCSCGDASTNDDYGKFFLVKKFIDVLAYDMRLISFRISCTPSATGTLNGELCKNPSISFWDDRLKKRCQIVVYCLEADAG